MPLSRGRYSQPLGISLWTSWDIIRISRRERGFFCCLLIVIYVCARSLPSQRRQHRFSSGFQYNYIMPYEDLGRAAEATAGCAVGRCSVVDAVKIFDYPDVAFALFVALFVAIFAIRATFLKVAVLEAYRAPSLNVLPSVSRRCPSKAAGHRTCCRPAENPPAGEEAALVELITYRVPAGVDDAKRSRPSSWPGWPRAKRSLRADFARRPPNCSAPCSAVSTSKPMIDLLADAKSAPSLPKA